MPFQEISPRDMRDNPFTLIGDKWMLITAGDERGHNTMTAAWGGMGVAWGKDTATILVRPQRHTRAFLEESGMFSLSFFLEGRREQLNLCGTRSGRDVDKTAACGFTPVFERGAVYFAEADLVFICRKIYAQDMDPSCFIDPALRAKWYPEEDYHRAYTGEIVGLLRRT